MGNDGAKDSWLNKQWKNNTQDVFLIPLFGIGVILVFAIEYYVQPLENETDILFNAIEFILSLGLGFSVQRVASKQDLKRYVRSAFRRISDISRTVARLRSHIGGIRAGKAEIQLTAIDLLDAVAEELSDTVRSSIYDWADVLPEEKEVIQRIKDLEDEISETIRSGPRREEQETEYKKRIDDLSSEYTRLKRSTPYDLWRPAEREFNEYPRSGLVLSGLYSLLDQSASEDKIIPLEFSKGTSFEGKFDPIDEEQFSGYYLYTEAAAGSEYVTLIDQKGAGSGFLITPYEELGIYHKDYQATLIQFLLDKGVLNYSGYPGMQIPEGVIRKVADGKNRVVYNVTIG